MKKTPVNFTCTINPLHNKDLVEILNNQLDFQQGIFIYRDKDYVTFAALNLGASGAVGISVRITAGSPYQKYEEDSYYISTFYEKFRKALNQDKPFNITVEETKYKTAVDLFITIDGQEPFHEVATKHKGSSAVMKLFTDYSVFREECVFKIPYSLRDRTLFLERGTDNSLRYALVKTQEVNLFIKTVEVPIIRKGTLNCDWTSVNMENTFKQIAFDGTDLNLLRNGTREPIWIIQCPDKENTWLAECKGNNYRTFLIQNRTDDAIFDAIFK